MEDDTSELDFKPAQVIWRDGDEIGHIEAAITNGWVHLRTQRGQVSSYPPDRVASIVWA